MSDEAEKRRLLRERRAAKVRAGAKSRLERITGEKVEEPKEAKAASSKRISQTFDTPSVASGAEDPEIHDISQFEPVPDTSSTTESEEFSKMMEKLLSQQQDFHPDDFQMPFPPMNVASGNQTGGSRAGHAEPEAKPAEFDKKLNAQVILCRIIIFLITTVYYTFSTPKLNFFTTFTSLELIFLSIQLRLNLINSDNKIMSLLQFVPPSLLPVSVRTHLQTAFRLYKVFECVEIGRAHV